MGGVGFVGFTDRATVGEGASLFAGRRLRRPRHPAGRRDRARRRGRLCRGRRRMLPAAASVMTSTSSSATSSRTASAGKSGARSPTIRRPARSPPGSRSRATRRRPTASNLKGLLLARSATINAKPELEIFADDVKCAHGATVGELDRNALFYIGSRGIPPDEAQACSPAPSSPTRWTGSAKRKCAKTSTPTRKDGSADGHGRHPPARSTGSPTSRRFPRAGPISTARHRAEAQAGDRRDQRGYAETMPPSIAASISARPR